MVKIIYVGLIWHGSHIKGKFNARFFFFFKLGQNILSAPLKRFCETFLFHKDLICCTVYPGGILTIFYYKILLPKLTDISAPAKIARTEKVHHDAYFLLHTVFILFHCFLSYLFWFTTCNTVQCTGRVQYINEYLCYKKCYSDQTA